MLQAAVLLAEAVAQAVEQAAAAATEEPAARAQVSCLIDAAEIWKRAVREAAFAVSSNCPRRLAATSARTPMLACTPTALA